MAAHTAKDAIGFASNLGTNKVITLFGHPLPDKVSNASHWYSVADGGTWIGWTLKNGNSHKYLLKAEGDPDDIIALLVTMRMSE
jgi:hypothetical protein